MNVIANEVVRSLFYNKQNQSLITVSVYPHDQYTSLQCRSTPIEYELVYHIIFLFTFTFTFTFTFSTSQTRRIKSGQPEAGQRIFQSESLSWPGFVEFDEVNNKVLTFSATEKSSFCRERLLFVVTL